MTFMIWTDNYLTGIETVDSQHKGLVELINQTAQYLALGPLINDQKISGLLDALTNYVVDHFSTEDHLMLEQAIDERHLQHHRQMHALFAEQVKVLRQQYEQGQDLNGKELLRYLSNWLAFHILGEDQRMAKELKAIAAGCAAKDIYEQLEGSKAEFLQSTNEVLVHALVDLFAQMTEQNRLLAEKNSRIEQAHQELESYRKNLELQIDIRTTELLEAKNAAEAAVRAKSRFFGTISHELLTPLNVIMGFAHLLDRAELSIKQKDQVKRIIVASEHLNELIKDVLQLSKLETGHIKIEKSPFSVTSLVTQVADRVNKTAQEKGLSITTYVDSTLPPLSGDIHLLLQAMETLASNAVKFTEKGSVELSAYLQNQTEDAAQISLEIKDSGIGIPVEKQANLFQAFEQIDASTTRKYQGIGLGLQVCVRLVKLLGGTLSLESSPGHGSVFRICLWLEKSRQTPGISGDNIDSISLSVNHEVKQLQTLLSENNFAARQVFYNIQNYLYQIDKEHSILLSKQINRYDFASALITLNKMMEPQ